MARLEGEGKTAVAAADDGQASAILAVADPVKPTSAEAIRLLHEMGVRVLMLTGDNRRTARAIARQVGIGEEDVIAEVLPEEKATAVERLQKEGLKVGMVGDGINDAPALIGDDLRGIVAAIRLSRATMAKIRQNLFWALIYNSLGIPFAAFGLLSPILAGAAMAFSSVSVVTNSTLLKRFDPQRGFERPEAPRGESRPQLQSV